MVKFGMELSSLTLRSLLYTTALTMLSVIPGGIARANPLDGVVNGGSATIVTGNKEVDITQQSDRAVIDWGSFNIGNGETTRFYQPNANAIVVNRIHDANPSSILGTLQANGNVVLINPNGVFFGKGSIVDVNGMLATTADIDTDKFMAGSNSFDKASPNHTAAIINNGQMTAKEAGLIGLVAPNVINNGVINAKLGRVELASGDTVTVDFRGNGLTEIAVSDDVKKQLIKNTGAINAAGGTIAITAAAGKNIVNSLINIKGELKAPMASMHNGHILIYAAGSNAVAGNIAANKGQKSGYSHVVIDAKIDASGKNAGESGGDVTVTGDSVVVKSGSVIDASGTLGGGTVLIGGDEHGAGTTSTSLSTTVEAGASILNNAITNGDGGKTIIWSDGDTVFSGSIDGRGGSQGGNGGFIETSGEQNLTATGSGDLSSISGTYGEWLFDPATIQIFNRSVTGQENNYPSGTAGTFTTAYLEGLNADLMLTASTSITLNMNSDTLTMASGKSITLTTTGTGTMAAMTTSTIKTQGTGTITLNSAGNIAFASAVNLTAGSGNISITSSAGGVSFTGTSTVSTTGAVSINALNSIVMQKTTTAASVSVTNTGATADITTGTAITATGASGINLTAGRKILTSANSTIKETGTGSILYAAGTDLNFTKVISFITGTGDVTLQANNDVLFSNNGGAVTTSGGKITVDSDHDASGAGAISTTAVTYTSNGGLITFGGGSTGTGYSVGSSATNDTGIFFGSGTVDAGGGNIVITGMGGGTANCDNNCVGVAVNGVAIQTTNSGTITINGKSGGSASNYSINGIQSYNGALSTKNGDITLNGQSSGAHNNGFGVDWESGSITTTGTGNINLLVDATTPLGNGGVNAGAAVINSANSITIAADNFNSYSGVSLTAANSVTIRPETSGITVGVGTSATGNAIVTDAILNAITASDIWIGGYGNVGDTGYINHAGNMDILMAANELNGNVHFATNGNLTVNSISANPVATGNVSMNATGTVSYNMSAGTMTLATNKNYSVTAGGNIANASGGTIQAHGTGTISVISTNNVTFDSTFHLLTDGGAITISGANTAVSGITIFGSTGTGNGTSTYTDTQVQTLSNSGNVSLTATNDIILDMSGETMSIATNKNFSLTAGHDIKSNSGGIINTSGTGSITLTAGNDINFSNAITLNAQGTGGVTLNANNNVILSTSNITTHGGNIALNADADVSGVGSVSLGSGIIQSGGGNITIAKAVALTANESLDAGTGTLSFGSTIDGGFDLAASGNTVSLGGAIGTTTAVGNVTVTAVNGLTLPSIKTIAGKTVVVTVTGSGNSITTSAIATGMGGNITLTSDDVTIGGNLSGTGTVTLQSNATTRTVDVASGTADGTNWNLSTAEITDLVDGWSQINIGRTNGNTAMNIGASSWSDPVNFRSANAVNIAGNITGTDNSSLTFSGNGTGWVNLGSTLSTAGQAITFNADVYAPNVIFNTNGGSLAFNKLFYVYNSGSLITANTSNGNISFAGKLLENGGSTAGHQLTLNAGTGTITFGNTIDGAYNLTASGSGITFGGVVGGTTALGAVALTSVNSMTLPEIHAASVNATTTGITADIAIGASITTSGIGTVLNSAHNITGVFGNTVRANGTGSLLLNAGNDIDFEDNINFYTNTGALTFQANNNIIKLQGAHGGGTVQTSGGNITFDADHDADGVGGIDTTGNVINSNGGNIVFGGGTDATSGYAVGTAATDYIGVNLYAFMDAGGGNIILNGKGGGLVSCDNNCVGVLANNGDIRTEGSGSILVKGASGGNATADSIDGIDSYTDFTTENGDITFNGQTSSQYGNSSAMALGGGHYTTTGSGSIHLNEISSPASSGGIRVYGTVNSNNNVTVSADSFGGGGHYNVTNNITFTTVSAGREINVADGSSGALDLSSAILDNITAGSITIGNTSQNGNINANAYIWSAPVTLLTNNGSINLTGVQNTGSNAFLAHTVGTGDIVIGASGGVASTATGDAIVLASNHNFINNSSDANVLSAANGRWLMYSTDPTDNTRGALLPNAAAIYGETYASNAPSTIASGNRFIFSAAASSAPTLTVTADDESKEYGTANGTLTYTVTGGYLSGDNASNAYSGNASITTTIDNTTNVGTYNSSITSAQGTLASNLGYQFTFVNGKYTVTAANLTITANSGTKNYGDTLNYAGTEFSVSGLKNSDSVSHVVLASAGAVATANASTTAYDVTAGSATGVGLDNYLITYVDGDLTVNKVALTVIANSTTKTYGDTLNYAGTEFSTVGLKNSDSITNAIITSLGANATANASTTPYDVTIGSATGTGLSNYNISYTDGHLTVNKANLSVTANNATKNYGATLHFVGNEFTASGLRNSDQVLAATLSSTGRTSTAADGNYAINVSNATGLGLSNYNITYHSGTLTVSPVAVVTPPPVTIPTNDLPQTVQVTSQDPMVSYKPYMITVPYMAKAVAANIGNAVINNLVEIDPDLLKEINFNPFYHN